MDAREIAEGISDGINALHALLAAAGATHDAVSGSAIAADEAAKGLDAMDRALAAFIDSKTVMASFRPRPGDLQGVRKLRQLVTVWRDSSEVPGDLVPLAEECLATVSAWR